MPAPHPKEFRDDVVAVVRRGDAPIAQVAKGFGISESCLRNWLHQADVGTASGPAPPGSSPRNSANYGGATACWNKRTKYSAGQPPTCRRRT